MCGFIARECKYLNILLFLLLSRCGVECRQSEYCRKIELKVKNEIPARSTATSLHSPGDAIAAVHILSRSHVVLALSQVQITLFPAKRV